MCLLYLLAGMATWLVGRAPSNTQRSSGLRPQVELLARTAAALACTQIQRDRWMFEKRHAAQRSSRANSDPRARFASIVEVGSPLISGD